MTANERGQATIEALVATLSLLSFTVLFLSLFYFLSLKAYLQFASHELLVCREIKESSLCDYNFYKDLKKYLNFGKIDQFQAQRQNNRQSMSLKLSFRVLGFKDFQWVYRDQISLPLKPT
jgi:hypothetical protein